VRVPNIQAESYTSAAVVMSAGHPYVGVDFARKLCGVSIIRSGKQAGGVLWLSTTCLSASTWLQ
jgi:hypothetical protein